MKDERIQSTIHSIAAKGFFLWYWLTLISFNYRFFILNQNPLDFWDFIAIFIVAIGFVFISFAKNGILDNRFKSFLLPIVIGVSVIIFAMNFIMGKIHSVVDVGTTLGDVLLGTGVIIGIAYFLNRYWKRKEGIEDEK